MAGSHKHDVRLRGSSRRNEDACTSGIYIAHPFGCSNVTLEPDDRAHCFCRVRLAVIHVDPSFENVGCL